VKKMATHSAPATGIFSAPLWRSAFRPFYLLGVIYGLGVMAVWLLVRADIVDLIPAAYNLSLWHGHEMVFGFSAAIVAGFVLTALPGWAGTAEIDGGRLALLVALWLLGRLAVHSGGLVPAMVVLVLDCSLFLVLAAMVTPGLLRAGNKYYLALLPIAALLFIGNVIFHLALIDGDLARASWGVRMGLMGIVGKFILAGGFLTTVFTGNALRQKGGPELAVKPWLEYLSALSLVAFIYGALGDLPDRTAAGLALFAGLAQLVRFLRWRTMRILDAPLVVTMHLAYGWFIAALFLFAAARAGAEIAPEAWLHAFTVGALSLMMLSLITRVALRHTGRSLTPGRMMILSFGLMVICALLRLAVSLDMLPDGWLPLTALTWSGSFLIYLLIHGLYMIRPSQPKKRRGPKRAAEISTTSS